jgi:hypothetical protein
VSTTIIFVAVVVAAFIGGRAISAYAARLQLLSGVEYLLLGAAIGPYSLGIMSHDVLAALDLFISFVLGVMGFLVGLGLRHVRGGLEVGLAGGTTALGVIGIVGCLAVIVVQTLDPGLLAVDDPLAAIPIASDGEHLLSLWIASDALWIGLSIGAAAGVSSVALIELAARRHAVELSRLGLLQSLGSAGQVTAVMAFGIAMAGARATDSAEALNLTVTEWGVITVGAGAACGVLFTVFMGREDDSMRILVASVGAITFSAGIGAALGVSPLFVNLIAGALVGVSSPHAARLDAALSRLRFPTRVLVLLIAGAYWSPVTGWAWLLPIAYALVRALALRVSAPVSAFTFLPGRSIAIRLDGGLFGQGALAAAIAVSFAQRFEDLAARVTTTVLGGMVLTDLLSPRMLRQYLADQGAIRPHEEIRPASAHEVAAVPVDASGASIPVMRLEPYLPDEDSEDPDAPQSDAPEPSPEPEAKEPEATSEPEAKAEPPQAKATRVVVASKFAAPSLRAPKVEPKSGEAASEDDSAPEPAPESASEEPSKS